MTDCVAWRVDWIQTRVSDDGEIGDGSLYGLFWRG